jgi:hypothetical protein
VFSTARDLTLDTQWLDYRYFETAFKQLDN